MYAIKTNMIDTIIRYNNAPLRTCIYHITRPMWSVIRILSINCHNQGLYKHVYNTYPDAIFAMYNGVYILHYWVCYFARALAILLGFYPVLFCQSGISQEFQLADYPFVWLANINEDGEYKICTGLCDWLMYHESNICFHWFSLSTHIQHNIVKYVANLNHFPYSTLWQADCFPLGMRKTVSGYATIWSNITKECRSLIISLSENNICFPNWLLMIGGNDNAIKCAEICYWWWMTS